MQKVLLGNIDQVKINRKCANDLSRGIGTQARDQIHQRLAFGFAIAFTQFNEAGPQRLDRMKNFRLFVLEQDISDQLAE